MSGARNSTEILMELYAVETRKKFDYVTRTAKKDYSEIVSLQTCRLLPLGTKMKCQSTTTTTASYESHLKASARRGFSRMSSWSAAAAVKKEIRLCTWVVASFVTMAFITADTADRCENENGGERHLGMCR